MTTYPIGEAMTETFTGTVSEMRVDRADYRCADCDDGDECCGCCECTFRTTPGLYLTVRLDDDTVGLHAGRVRVTYESPDQPEPVITTASELDALPVGSVVRSEEAGGATVAEKNKWSRWDIAGLPISGTLAVTAEDLIANAPFAVLYRPDQPEPVKPSREAVAAAMNAADVRFATAEHIANAGVGPDPGSWWEAMADAVLALLPAIPGQNPAELAAHDAEVAAKALYEAARDAQAEKADGLLRGVVGVTWLRARAAAIRAEAQR